MRSEDIIRAWKDEAFREGLTDDQLTYLPDSPVGMVELNEEGLTQAAGGTIVPIPITFFCPSIVVYTIQCCPFTFYPLCYV